MGGLLTAHPWHATASALSAGGVGGAERPNQAGPVVLLAQQSGARTELDLATDESAVLENIGLTIESTQEVNAAVLEYTPTRLCIALNGLGSAMLHLAPITSVAGGAMPILEGAAYTVTVDGIPEKYTASATSLRIELLLSGEHEIVVARDPL